MKRSRYIKCTLSLLIEQQVYQLSSNSSYKYDLSLIEDKMYMICFNIFNGHNSMRQNYNMAWWASKIILEKLVSLGGQ